MDERKNPPLFFDWIKESAIVVGDGIKTGAVATGKFVKKHWKPILVGILTIAAGTIVVAALSNNDDNPDIDNNTDDADDNGGEDTMPEISQKAYNDIETFLGKGKADEVAEQVRAGNMTPDAADNWGKQLWEQYEHSRGRRDIDPEEWQKFEEGWRPKGR